MNSARKPRRVRRRQREKGRRIGEVSQAEARESVRVKLDRAYRDAQRDAWERGV